MTKKITVASHKGGVGKTTTALNLGHSLSLMGKKVLVVDADLQGGVAVACNLVAKSQIGLIQVLREEISLNESIFFIDRSERLAVIGTGIELPEDIVFFEEQAAKGVFHERLQAGLSGFDYVIFDAPAGIGTVTKELLSISDSMIHVINCRASTVKSIAKLLRLFIWIRKTINADIRLAGILISMFHSESPVEQRFLKIIRARLPSNLLFEATIPHDEVFEKASIKAVPVGRMVQGEKAARAYRNLAEEISAREERGEGAGDDLADAIVDRDQQLEQEFADGGSEINLAENRKNDQIHQILVDLCDNGECHGALVADEMGFLLADYQVPLSVDSLAAFSSILGEALVKAESIIDMPLANNLALDLNDSDKVVLRWCSIFGERYFLLVVCPQEAEVLGEMEQATEKIADELS